MVNSLYDPLGFLAPVTIQGRLLLRDLTKQAEDWGSPLPGNREAEWTRWRDSLKDLQELQIPRTYTSFSPSSTLLKELCVFADASTMAIAAVAYLKATTGHTEVGFIFGKAKLAPQPDLSIPRLELCAAVLAVEIAELIVGEMDLEVDCITYYSDSKVVLGYIPNQARRFFVYVNNRVQRIRQSTSPDQWRHVPTDHNPADHGSRSIQAALSSSTTWPSGPAFNRNPSPHPLKPQETFDLVNPASDSDLHPEIAVNLTVVSRHLTDPTRFGRCSKWTVTTTVAPLILAARSFALPAQKGSCRGWHICPRGPSEEEMDRARIFVMRPSSMSFMQKS